jgi:hypothetical protein
MCNKTSVIFFIILAAAPHREQPLTFFDKIKFSLPFCRLLLSASAKNVLFFGWQII